MKLAVFFCFIISLVYPIDSLARKKKYSKRAFSLSLVNAWTFYPSKENKTAFDPKDAGNLVYGDGQMRPSFSALELARNFGRYELGARIQNLSNAFVSPFFKFNFIKNYSRAVMIPSLTWGVVPAQISGTWLRASLALKLSHYSSLEPLIGFYYWRKLKELPVAEKSGWHFHTGLRINLYF